MFTFIYLFIYFWSVKLPWIHLFFENVLFWIFINLQCIRLKNDTKHRDISPWSKSVPLPYYPLVILMNFRSCMIFLSPFLDFDRIPILTDSSLARLNSGILYLLNRRVKQTVLARFYCFLLATFWFIKKIPANPKNFYPYPQTSPWHPFILKIIIFKITLKKYTYKSENTLMMLFNTKNSYI